MLCVELVELEIRAAKFKLDLLLRCKVKRVWQGDTLLFLSSKLQGLRKDLLKCDLQATLNCQRIVEVARLYSHARQDPTPLAYLLKLLLNMYRDYDFELLSRLEDDEPEWFHIADVATERVLDDLNA